MNTATLRSYSTEQWRRFRSEVFELDGHRCRRCAFASTEGAILQVHHKHYVGGRLPWEYPYSACETLCKGCHASEHGIIPPKAGWDFVGQEDLGELCGECENCGTTIRHVFHIQHAHWEPMSVGTICCDNLTGTQLASDHMESLARFASRQNRFVSSSRWRSDNGGTSIRQKNIDLSIREDPGGYQIQMNGCCGKQRFQSIEAAKKAAFEVIENGRAEVYLRGHGFLLKEEIRTRKRNRPPAFRLMGAEFQRRGARPAFLRG